MCTLSLFSKDLVFVVESTPATTYTTETLFPTQDTATVPGTSMPMVHSTRTENSEITTEYSASSTIPVDDLTSQTPSMTQMFSSAEMGSTTKETAGTSSDILALTSAGSSYASTEEIMTSTLEITETPSTVTGKETITPTLTTSESP